MLKKADAESEANKKPTADTRQRQEAPAAQSDCEVSYGESTMEVCERDTVQSVWTQLLGGTVEWSSYDADKAV